MSLYTVQPEVQVQAIQQGSDLVAVLPSFVYERKLTRLNIVGPASSAFALYKHGISPTTRIDSTPRGDNNTADYSNPIHVEAGVVLVAQWQNATGTAFATFFLE